MRGVALGQQEPAADPIREILERLESESYVADASIATSIYMAQALERPLLIEGRAGVGKTEVANVMARLLDTKLIRLQCYEGLDVTTALYEWNYPKQLLWIKLQEQSGGTAEEMELEIFSEAFLLKRPLLAALTQTDKAPVLLIDEIDRADEEFEAFLLEVLSDFQVSIPRDRHGQGHSPATGDPDLQPLPRPVGRPSQTVSVPLDRLPRP